MNSIESYLQIMKQVWQREPVVKSRYLIFYLTPEQRYERLKELMAPLSQNKKHL